MVDDGRLPLFACFAAFVVTFVVTRTITRLIRSGRGPFKDNVAADGLHVHHAVPGVILLVAGAFMAVAIERDSAWLVAAGLLVGIGTSLVLDEFALILHLEDVYWSDEGRISVEIASLAVACLGLVLVGADPFEITDEGDAVATAIGAAISIGFHLGFVMVCVAKGKVKMALFGVFIPIVAPIGAVRLARPTSRWAKRRYGADEIRRAVDRAARHDARWGPLSRRFTDAIAGRPTERGAPDESIG